MLFRFLAARGLLHLLLPVVIVMAQGLAAEATADQAILNVSYDPTGELYKAINAAFIADRC